MSGVDSVGSPVTLSRQAPITADVSLTIDDQPPTAVWSSLFSPQSLRAPFIDVARQAAAGETIPELYDTLLEIGLPRFLIQRIRDTGRGNRQTAFETAQNLSNLLDSRGLESAVAVLRLFEYTDVTPSVAVQVKPEFFERRRDQREDICRILDTLANGADVTVYGSGIELRRLATEHRRDLSGVSEWCNQQRERDTIEDAIEQLSRDGRAVSILRTLADEPGETMPYSALYATATVSKSRVRQLLSTLADVGCVETYRSQQDRYVELTATGRAFLNELARQSSSEAAVSEPTQSPQQCRVSAGKDERGGEGDRPYRTAYLNRSSAMAATACGTDGAVTTVADDAYPGASDRTLYVSYLDDRNEAVVAVRASSALQYAVSVAVALASPEFFDRALPTSRLDAIDEPAAILRDARCIGGLSTAAEDDPQKLRDTLVEWGNDLADMTTKLKAGEYNDRNRYRCEIMRSAHGLAGSIVHLLDAAGVSLTRELRVPGRLSDDQIEELATTLSYSLAIQSKYDSFSAYRQLYEDREDKRASAFSVNVDASAPTGTLIGGVVIRSGAANRVGNILGDAVRNSLELVDDAPEFAVSIPVRQAGTRTYRAVASQFSERKRLSMNDGAIRALSALTASPYAAAEALVRLGTESITREITSDELRYALATLPADRLTDIPPTAQSMLSVLLAAEDSLSKTELADRADISSSSVRRHLPTLTALGITLETDTGYRCVFSFRGERGPDRGMLRGLSPQVALHAVLSTQLPPSQYANPDDDLAAALYWPPDPWRILDDPPPGIAGWCGIARALVDSCDSPKMAEIDGEPIAQIELGAPTPQQAVTAVPG